MKYEVWGVTADGEAVKHRAGWTGAPTDNQLYGWAQRKNLAFVTRFYPTRKGWLLHDTRVLTSAAVRRHGAGGMLKVFRGVRGAIVYPSYEAAVMTAIHRTSWPQHLQRN